MKNVGETAGPGSVLPSLASWLLGWPRGHTRCCPRPLSPQAGAAFRPVCWLKPNPWNLQAGTEGVPPIPRLGNCSWDSSGPGSRDGLGEAGSVFVPARGRGGPTSKAPRGLCCFSRQGPRICSGCDFMGSSRPFCVFGGHNLESDGTGVSPFLCSFWPCSEAGRGLCHSPLQTSLVPVNKGAGAGLWIREDLGRGAALPCLLVMLASF